MRAGGVGGGDASASILRVNLHNIILRVAEEYCAVAPFWDVGGRAEDGDSMFHQFGVAGVDGGQGDAEGKLD